MTLYKTEIVIWSTINPEGVDTQELVELATGEDTLGAVVAAKHVQKMSVTDAMGDHHWSLDIAEFLNVGSREPKWDQLVCQRPDADMLEREILAFGTQSGDARVWAARWLGSLELEKRPMWGLDELAKVRPDDPTSKWWEDAYVRHFWCKVDGAPSSRKVTDPVIWAETARVMELDAKERDCPGLDRLTRDVVREITQAYEGSHRFNFAESTDSDMESKSAFAGGLLARLHAFFGQQHSWKRLHPYDGARVRISDIGDSPDWGVSIAAEYQHHIGTWLVLICILDARARRLSREFYEDHPELVLLMELEPLSMALPLLAVGLDDSLRRILNAMEMADEGAQGDLDARARAERWTQ